MSLTEIERFQSDIRVLPDLAAKIKASGHGLGAIALTANSEGYEFNLIELKEYVVAKSSGNLSDEQLANVAAAGSTWAATNTIVVALTAGAVIGVVVGAVVVT